MPLAVLAEPEMQLLLPGGRAPKLDARLQVPLSRASTWLAASRELVASLNRKPAVATTRFVSELQMRCLLSPSDAVAATLEPSPRGPLRQRQARRRVAVVGRACLGARDGGRAGGAPRRAARGAVRRPAVRRADLRRLRARGGARAAADGRVPVVGGAAEDGGGGRRPRRHLPARVRAPRRRVRNRGRQAPDGRLAVEV